MPDNRSFTAEPGQDGQRLDRFLSVTCPDLSRTYLQELIEEGFVSCGGKKTDRSSRRLRAGETVEISIPDPEPAEISAEPMELDILYEDDDLLVVNKPKGLAVHPAPGHEHGTLVNGLLAHCGDSLSGIGGVQRPGIVHRIDMNTTGTLVVCKNDASHRNLAAQLKEHSIRRVYRAVCIGCPREDEGTVTGNIGRSPRDRKKMAVVKEGGRHAVTHYRVLERFPGYSYCEFRLETGRTHQIRVHMASVGHPILGDDVYGPSSCPFRLEGQTLHAMTIGFLHPTTGAYMEFSAPLPDYFRDLLDKLRAAGR